MTTITINERVFSIHPVYDLYAGSKDGNIIHIIKKVPNKGDKRHNDYLMCSVKKYGGRQKSYQVHRFIWEAFNGVIPDGKVIDHINNIKDDNRLCNLQLLTQQQNCKKSAKDRDYTFATKNHENRKCIKTTNKNTNEESYYYSMYAVQQHLGINAGIVKMVCEGINNYKSGVSKKDGDSYTFEYIKQEDLPDNYKKSSCIKPRKILNEDEWKNKEYKCPKCDRTMRNKSKYKHKKRCQ